MRISTDEKTVFGRTTPRGEQAKAKTTCSLPKLPEQASQLNAATNLFRLPPEVWENVFRQVALPPSGVKSIGDFKSLRLVDKNFYTEAARAHQELVDLTASGAARAFLEGAESSLTLEEKNLLKNARFLDLSQVSASLPFTVRLCVIFSETPKLRGLHLSGNRLGHADACNLPLDNLENLKVLDLGANEIGDAGARDLRIAKLTNLRVLNLSYNQIGPDGTRDLPIVALKSMENLNLNSNQLGDAGARNLPIAKLENLQMLDLRSNQIGAFGARDLPIAKLRSLHTMDLDHNQIGDAGAGDLPLSELENLESLYLNGNQIGAVGSHNLCISKLKKMRTLDLRNNPIGDASAQELRNRAPEALVVYFS